MSENFFSFDNKFMMLENPLPRLTLEELHKRAKVNLRRTKHAKHQVFILDLRYGAGVDLKTKSLRPSEKIRMGEKEGNEVIQDFKPQGDICATNPGLAWYPDGAENPERKQALIDALLVAEKHYHTLGAEQIDGVRNSRGHSESDIERYRHSIYSTYFLAMEKEKVIREKIDQIQNELEQQQQQRKAS